jgi:hypothetical protein
MYTLLDLPKELLPYEITVQEDLDKATLDGEAIRNLMDKLAQMPGAKPQLLGDIEADLMTLIPMLKEYKEQNTLCEECIEILEEIKDMIVRLTLPKQLGRLPVAQGN